MSSICIAPGCTKPVHIRKWNLCRNDYEYWRRHGTLVRVAPPTVCVVCGKPVRALDYCAPHYECYRRTGNPRSKDEQIMRLQEELSQAREERDALRAKIGA